MSTKLKITLYFLYSYQQFLPSIAKRGVHLETFLYHKKTHNKSYHDVELFICWRLLPKIKPSTVVAILHHQMQRINWNGTKLFLHKEMKVWIWSIVCSFQIFILYTIGCFKFIQISVGTRLNVIVTRCTLVTDVNLLVAKSLSLHAA